MAVVSGAAVNVVGKALANKPSRIKACGYLKQMSMINSVVRSLPIGKERTNNASSDRKLKSSTGGTKRKFEEVEYRKMPEMDHYATWYCKVVIEKLLKHRFGSPFKKPVDPVELGIPDYFRVIKKPMDLGTIKKKLDDNKYKDPEEFESDVRLIFSNAMHYNPPDDSVHQYAMELMIYFNHLWKPVKVKMCRQLEGVKETCSQNTIGEAPNNANRKCLESFSSHPVKFSGNTVLSSEIDPKELTEISIKKKVKLNTQCENLRQLNSQKPEKNTCDESQRFLKSCSDKLSGKTMRKIVKDLTEVSTKMEEKVKGHCGSMKPWSSQNIVCKTTHDTSRKCLKTPLSDVDVKKVKAKGPTSSRICRSDTGTDDGSSKVLCAGLSAMKVKCENAKELRQERKVPNDEIKSVEVVKKRSTQLSKSDQDSNRDASCLDENHVYGTSDATASGYSSSVEGSETVFDIQLSPTRALRAAMLKNRFADTILKAQQNMLLQSGCGTDSMKLQQQKKSLERKQLEGKAKIEAQLRVAEKAELIKRREQARVAIEKMEQSVDVDDNFHVLRELEKLIGKPLFIICKSPDGRSDATACLWDKIDVAELRSPLEEVGLFINTDDDDEEEEELREGELEEGEVVF